MAASIGPGSPKHSSESTRVRRKPPPVLMNFSERYPAPDPLDPFAPLWVLRDRTSSNAVDVQRPSATDCGLWHSTFVGVNSATGRLRSGSPLMPPQVLSVTRSGSLDVPLISPTPPLNILYADDVTDRCRPHSVSTFASGVLFPAPPSPSPVPSSTLLPSSPPQSPNCQPIRMLSATPPFVDLDINLSGSQSSPMLPVVGSLSDHDSGRDHPLERQKRKSRISESKFARILLGNKRPSRNNSSTGRNEMDAFPRLRAASHAGLQRRQQPHYQTHQQTHLQLADGTRTANAKVKPTISPPVISTVVWESQLTGRKFLPIGANPIYNNAIFVQPVVQKARGSDHAVGSLDTPNNDEHYRRGRRGSSPPGNDRFTVSAKRGDIRSRSAQPSFPFTLRGERTVQRERRMDTPELELQTARLIDDQTQPTLEPVPPPPPPPPSAPPSQPLLGKRGVSAPLAPLTTTSSYVQGSIPSASTIHSFSTAMSHEEPEETVEVPQPARLAVPEATPLPTLQIPPHPAATELLSPPPATANSASAISPQSASTTKAQDDHCHYPSHQSASLPPQTEWTLPTPSHLAYAASLPIFQADGTSIRFGSLFAEHRTIVLFLRHFFCPLCQDYVSSLSSLVRQPVFREAGVLCDFNEEDARVGEGEEGTNGPRQVQLVLVSNGKPALVERYREIFDLPFRMYSDPEMMVYEALGMGKVPSASQKGARLAEEDSVRSDSSKSTTEEKAGYVRHGLVGGIAMVVVRALKVGMPVWENGGDIAQLGGEFVLGPGLTCSYAHRMQTTKGHAPILDLLKAANVRLPEDNPLPPSTSSVLSQPSSKDKSPAKEKLPRKRRSTLSSMSPSNLGQKAYSASVATSATADTFYTVSGSLAAPDRTPKSRRRESLVAHTLRSMSSMSFSRTNSSRGSLGSRTAVGTNVALDSHHHHPSYTITEFPAPSQVFAYSVEVEDAEERWMENRELELERLKQRKDARRNGGAGKKGVAGLRPQYYYQRHTPAAASMPSLPDGFVMGNGGPVKVPALPLPVSPPPQIPTSPKSSKSSARSRSRSLSASLKSFLLRD